MVRPWPDWPEWFRRPWPCKPNIGDPNVNELCLQLMGVSPGLLLQPIATTFPHGQPEVAAILVVRPGSVVSTGGGPVPDASRHRPMHQIRPREFATEVCDLIIRPPVEAPYDSLREQLICFRAEEVAAELFSAEELGDRKPSQLLRRLQQLMGECASHRQHIRIPAGALLEASPWQCPHDPGLYCQLEQFG